MNVYIDVRIIERFASLANLLLRKAIDCLEFYHKHRPVDTTTNAAHAENVLLFYYCD